MLMAQSIENGGIFIYNSLDCTTPTVTPHKYRWNVLYALESGGK